jgi:hypothetical protein
MAAAAWVAWVAWAVWTCNTRQKVFSQKRAGFGPLFFLVPWIVIEPSGRAVEVVNGAFAVSAFLAKESSLSVGHNRLGTNPDRLGEITDCVATVVLGSERLPSPLFSMWLRSNGAAPVRG